MKDLDYYIGHFRSLRRDYSFGGAPHKPVLLLSVIEAYEEDIYQTNKIYLSADLVDKFRSIWNLLVTSEHNCDITMPFYAMKNEKGGFWKLITKPGRDIPITKSHSVRSFSALRYAVDYAEIDLALFELFMDPDKRNIIKFALLETYFKDTYPEYLQKSKISLIHQFEKDIVEEDPEKYIAKIKMIINSESKASVEEIMYIRREAFRRKIPEIYHFTCAVTGHQTHMLENFSLIDACHILPFSETHNDSITNGIALSPTIHRAFDRGLIGIDDDYRILVSNKFVENESSFSLRQYHMSNLHLPSSEQFYPAMENLRKHRIKWGL